MKKHIKNFRIFIWSLIIFHGNCCTDLLIKHVPAPPGQRPAFSPRAPASTLSFSVLSTLSSISLVSCCWYPHQNISSWAGQRLLWLLSVLHAQCLCTQLRHGQYKIPKIRFLFSSFSRPSWQLTEPHSINSASSASSVARVWILPLLMNTTSSSTASHAMRWSSLML